MKNWQYDYAIDLLRQGREAIEEEKRQIEYTIKKQDKRTRNGRIVCIFERAKLYVIDALLQI